MSDGNPHGKPPARVLGYARVSTSEQDSLESQVAKIRGYCDLHGLDLVDVVIDRGESAKSLERPGMRRVLADLQAGLASGVVIYKLDRLTRNMSDWSHLIERYFGPESRTALMSVTDSIDTSKASGRMVLNVLMSVAQWERETIIERTQDAINFRKAAGRRTGSIPWGKSLDADGTTLVPCVKEIKATRIMLTLEKGGTSLREIAATLDDLGIPPRDGGAWQPSSVRKILARCRAEQTQPKEALP